jgi:predicted Fe-Mo cluster-binding NifX family protein
MNTRLAISIEEKPNGEEIVAEHFGRCSKFKVCEVNDKLEIIKEETYFNPLSGEHNGACQLPGYVKQFNVKTIIAGGMGQKAINNFLSYNIDVITAPGLLYENALDLFLSGQLKGYESCKINKDHHH